MPSAKNLGTCRIKISRLWLEKSCYLFTLSLFTEQRLKLVFQVGRINPLNSTSASAGLHEGMMVVHSTLSLLSPCTVCGFYNRWFKPLRRTEYIKYLLISVYLPTFSEIKAWGCRDFWRRPDHFRRFPKKFEVFRRISKSSENVRSPSPSLRTRINASSLPVLFTSKIRAHEEGIVIYSFYTWFLLLTWVWVNMFLEIVSSKTATTHIFQ